MGMNFRVILLVVLVLIFTTSGVYLNVLSFGANSLKDTYNDGDLEIIQNTTAGTVPHVVQVKNNGKKPVMVEAGQILLGESSQDMVAAESKRVNQNSSSYIRAYCLEPNQTANPGEKLKPGDKASTEIMHIIDNSNFADTQNTIRSQLQIWIILSGGNVDITQGEASALIKKQGISSAKITGELNEAKTSLIQALNITEGEIKDIKPSSSISIDDLINGFINWMKNAFNI